MGTNTVYVVEDNHQLRDSLRWLLEGAGFQVACFATAGELLSAGPASFCGCMITDVMMPGMDGVDLLQEMGRQAPDLRSIVITAYDSKKLRERAVAAGASAYLRKPFEAGVLLSHVRMLLRSAMPDGCIGPDGHRHTT